MFIFTTEFEIYFKFILFIRGGQHFNNYFDFLVPFTFSEAKYAHMYLLGNFVNLAYYM